MEEFLPYIMPVFRRCGDARSFAGTAFCIDGYLVTAGHVLDGQNVHYVRNGGNWHPLHLDNWIPRQLPSDDRMGYDVALYPVPGLKSPLSLAPYDARDFARLNIACWQPRPGEPARVVTEGLVLDEPSEPRHLCLATSSHITHGCSGCPVFDGEGRVYGMVTMGRHADAGTPPSLGATMQQNTCWAFKATAIAAFLR